MVMGALPLPAAGPARLAAHPPFPRRWRGPVMKVGRPIVSAAVAALVVTTGLVVLHSGAAQAHGAMMSPGSRTVLCCRHGLTQTGTIRPQNPACAAAVAQSGVTPLYNW